MGETASVRLEVPKRRLSVCKVADASGIDLETELVFFGHTADEYSLVCPVDVVPDNVVVREDGWRALRIQGTLDFGLVGILAKIAQVLAEAAIPIFVVSTFDTDYVLVKEETLEKALQALDAAGYVI